MKTVKGDLIALGQQGEFDVIVHGCNCFCRMRSGIAVTMKNAFPEVERIDNLTEVGDMRKLGTIGCVEAGDLIVVNAYTQHSMGNHRRHADYAAIRCAFKEIKNRFSGKRIGYPMIGAGLAGGDWDIISDIISEELDGEDHTLVVFGDLLTLDYEKYSYHKCED